jgi:hypothetical protein
VVLHAFFPRKERQSDTCAFHQKLVALASSLATCWIFMLHLRQYLYYTKTADFLHYDFVYLIEMEWNKD